MNKEHFKSLYKLTVMRLGETPENVVVSAGGALLMFGLREETSDIDLDVSEETFKRFEHFGELEYFGDKKIINLDNLIALHQMEGDVEVVEIEGVFVYSVESLISFKKKLINNPLRKKEKIEQDLSDLSKLEILLKSS